MEVIQVKNSEDVVQNFSNNQNGNQFDQTDQDNNEDGQLNNDIFSKKKNMFRVEIRNRKTKALLQSKRIKANKDENEDEGEEILPPFQPEIIEQTFIEFEQQCPDLNLIEQNLKILRSYVHKRKDILSMIKQSRLFMKLVHMITWGRDQPDNMFKIACHLVNSILVQEKCSDVVEQLADLLLCRDIEKNLINDDDNNQKLHNNNKKDKYVLSVLENHICNDQDLLIREYGIVILSNISGENNYQVNKIIMSKGKLFMILKENIEDKNWSEDILESIVNLLYNISCMKNKFEFVDFVNVLDLVKVIFPLISKKEKYNSSLMYALKRIVKLGNDDELYNLVNEKYDLICEMSCFIQGSDIKNKYECECSEFILKIFSLICNQNDQLTKQMVGLGILDSIGYIMNMNLIEIPCDLLEGCLDLLAVIFSQGNHEVNDSFLNSKQFNHKQVLTSLIIDLCEAPDSNIKNAALNCISQLIGGCNSDQCDLAYESNFMQVTLQALKSEDILTNVTSEILNGLCNLIYMGNLESDDVEKNKYSNDFLKYQGDKIIEQIQQRLDQPQFYTAQRLINLVYNGNDEVDEEYNS